LPIYAHASHTIYSFPWKIGDFLDSDYSSALKMEAAASSKKLVNFHQHESLNVYEKTKAVQFTHQSWA
jgi:hypothetical protein